MTLLLTSHAMDPLCAIYPRHIIIKLLAWAQLQLSNVCPHWFHFAPTRTFCIERRSMLLFLCMLQWRQGRSEATLQRKRMTMSVCLTHTHKKSDTVKRVKELRVAEDSHWFHDHQVLACFILDHCIDIIREKGPGRGCTSPRYYTLWLPMVR